jgi:hypothetical protein
MGNAIYVVWCGHQLQGKRGKKKQRQRAILVLASSKQVETRILMSFCNCISLQEGSFLSIAPGLAPKPGRTRKLCSQYHEGLQDWLS